jgi:nucleoid-associated protein YgaU
MGFVSGSVRRALAGALIAGLFAWAAGVALAAESIAAEPEVTSDYQQEVASEAEGFRPSGVPVEASAAPGRAAIAPSGKPTNRDHVDQIKAAVNAALGAAEPPAPKQPTAAVSEESGPTRRQQIRELVIETPVPESLQGDEYIGELRDEVSQTTVFETSVGVQARADVTGVVEASVAPALRADAGIYQVQPGDSLWKIAQALLGDGHKWADIYEANRASLMNKDVLLVGQWLTIPNL